MTNLTQAVPPLKEGIATVVFLLVHDDWEECGGRWQRPPWPTFAVGGTRLWPEEPVWVNADVTGFLRCWHRERDPRKIELWLSSGEPGAEVCYFTSEEPKGLRTMVEEPASWWLMRAVW